MLRSWLCARSLRVPSSTSCSPKWCYQRFYSSIWAAELKFGQPVHETHPHLIAAGDVTPGISALEYAKRRAKLAEKLPKNSVALLPSASIQYRSGVVFHEFHQEADFFYLTGFNEPEALAVIEKTGQGSEHKFHLYVRPNDAQAQLWEGTRSGPQAAMDIFNADESESVERLPSILPSILSSASAIYTEIETKDPPPKSLLSSFGLAVPPKDPLNLHEIFKASSVQELNPYMWELRAIKSKDEIKCMRTAGQNSGRAFTDAMRKNFSTESELAAFLDFKFRTSGCEASAYVPVVASGENALCIHYVQNNARIEKDKLILVDAGGQYSNYVTDITRTWPANGKFTQPQRDLYTAVLDAQRRCVSLCRADSNLSLDAIHNRARNTLRHNLIGLGFELTHRHSADAPTGDDLDGLFPHHVGHYVGLHLHDTPGYPRSKALVEGQVVTIEPGLYIPDNERWPKAFRGMGIRIEDTIAVEKAHPFVLTTEAVKEIDDIEALRD